MERRPQRPARVAGRAFSCEDRSSEGPGQVFLGNSGSEADISPRVDLPVGTVTLLVAHIDAGGSLRDSEADGSSPATTDGLRVVHDAIARHGGVCSAGQGDKGGVVAVFTRPSAAVAAALASQHAMADRSSARRAGPKLRAGIHSAEAQVTPEGKYFGQGVDRAGWLAAIADGGQVLLSRAVHDLVVDTLQADVTLVDRGVHRLGGFVRLEQVFSLDHPALPHGAVVRTLDARPNNLPHQLTSFIGRERELADVRDVLAERRLLTLTGAGGCGKTRLALQVATDVLERFPGGVWWIDLGPVGDERLVGAAIAEPLGVRPLPGMTELQGVCAHLGGKRALVILDNCEHLLEVCREAADALVAAGPEVRVLATSRASLGASEEVAWRVPSLSLPRDGSGAGAALTGSDAVRLFIERAVSSRTGFSVTSENAPSVERICSDLDGIPLAIELAAARIRMLSVEQIAVELSDRFRLLGGGDGGPPRQQTLRASVDWSYELLSGKEQALLRRLSVFAGGCNLAALEGVCTGDAIDRHEVLNLLGALVDRSLVTVEDRGAIVRYRLLETVREYARDRVEQAGELAALRDRHRDFFLALVEGAAPLMATRREAEGLELLDQEAANIAAAIDRSVATAPGQALRFCDGLFMWWRATGRYREAETAYSRALEVSAGESEQLRASVLWSRSYLALASGELEATQAHAAEALALAEDAGDQGTAARALCGLGLAKAYADPAAGRPALKRAAELARAGGDGWALSNALEFVALSYLFQDDHAQVWACMADAAAVEGQGEDVTQVARRALALGSVLLLDGRLVEARETFERGLSGWEGSVDRILELIWIDAQFGLISVLEGHPERALERLGPRLERAIKTGAGVAIPAILLWTAFAEIGAGYLEQARQRLDATIPIIEGRDALLSMWALWLRAETLRLLNDEEAEAAAKRAVEAGDRAGNRLGATRPKLTLARLAARRSEWSIAEQHALAHLDACVEGAHTSFVPACLDALAEIAAGLESHEEAIRLQAAATRAHSELGLGRWTPEQEHWDAIEARLRAAVGDAPYQSTWQQGAELTIDETIGWVRRARGTRKRPAGGWESLTPTEVQVVNLVAEGLTNPQIGERMFISPATVKVHVKHVFGKLEINTRAELAAKAARRET